ncbi:MAG: pseudouridine synthase [Actinomycetota bacterium]|nr:pseudouridine synthase [Actinomycetota bacterium]
MTERIRIQKAIANAGLMSRRKAEEAIEEGRVRIDGRSTRLGDRVDVESELLTLDGAPLPVNPALRTYLLYKPVGVVSTADDPQGRTTVVELIEDEVRLYPVGRLDADSEGLILISNDGELTNRVTHPRYGITKRYVALVDGKPSRGQIRRLVDGVELDDGRAAASSARLLDGSGGQSLVEIVMVEGRNREVRRMFSTLGFEVSRLVRTAIGPISDQRLKEGESRLLETAEVASLLASSTN